MAQLPVAGENARAAAPPFPPRRMLEWPSRNEPRPRTADPPPAGGNRAEAGRGRRWPISRAAGRSRRRRWPRSAAGSTAAREALDELPEGPPRAYEGELQDLEAKRSKYKGQLMDVKTNKEYTAMLHEIEGVEREIRGARGPDPGRDGEGRDARRRGQARGGGLQGRRGASTAGAACASSTRRSRALQEQARPPGARSATRWRRRSAADAARAASSAWPAARHRPSPRPATACARCAT